ncbi:MAG: succinylglutamate desuccinylase [Candidatus Zhuqueibacterota bacterium]
MKRHSLLALLFLAISIGITVVSAKSFLKMRQPEPIFPGPGVTEKRMLSDYFPDLKNSHGDTEVYLLRGKTAGATVLLLGGTHPNEPAGFLSALFLIENCAVDQGQFIIIPRANNSAFTHNDPQEGNPQRFTIHGKNGERWFRFGSRCTNPVDQWPDPEVYLHYPSGQKLSGSETRNLNRSYPGRPNGAMTEKIAFAIMELMKQEQVDLGFDLHEASPEYPVINAVVAHPLASDLAGEAIINLQMQGLNFNIEPSPQNFHGLSHREWGDFLNIPAILMESANTVQGRYHGRLTEDVVLSGKDRFYHEAAQHGLLEVEYPAEGIPMVERVGRHLAALQTIFQVWNEYHPGESIVVQNIPDYFELQAAGLGAYLN